MEALKGFSKIVAGLIVAGIGVFLEMSLLGLCFGTVIVGIIILFWRPLLLLMPITFVVLPGLGLVCNGLGHMKAALFPFNAPRAAKNLKSLVFPQLLTLHSDKKLSPLFYAGEITIAYILVCANYKSMNITIGDAGKILKVYLLTMSFDEEDSSNLAWQAVIDSVGSSHDRFLQALTDMRSASKEEISDTFGNFLVDYLYIKHRASFLSAHNIAT